LSPNYQVLFALREEYQHNLVSCSLVVYYY
jgi:hypothetical protein